MPFDEEVRGALDGQMLPWKGVSARAMFGGVAYMVDGKMFSILMEGVVGAKLPPELRARALTMAGVSPLRGPSGAPFGEWIQFVMLMDEDVPTLVPWLEAAFNYVGSLPAPKRRTRRRSR